MSKAWSPMVETLAGSGCRLVVGVPSDEPGLLDAAIASSCIRGVQVRDQRVASCLASGFAAATRTPAIVAVSSGPSIVNALTGLLEASSLCLPLVVVTTRIPSAGLGRGGFQELDQPRLAPFWKWSFTVEQDHQLVWATRRAVYLAMSGRRGVTMIEVAHEIVEGFSGEPRVGPQVVGRSLPDPADLSNAMELMRGAERPLLLAGGGARVSGGGEAFEQIAEMLAAPMFTTASGRGFVDETHSQACGLAGLYATPPADSLLRDCDLLVAVGTQFEETATMGWEPASKRVIHADIDTETFGRVIEPDVALVGDAKAVLRRVGDLLGAEPPKERRHWLDKISDVKRSLLRAYSGTFDGSPTRAALASVDAVFGTDFVLVQENGLHDMWSYHYPVLSIRAGQIVLTPGEQTMMGFGFPAAIGAALGVPGKPVVLLCGDGAINMSVNAIPTAAELECGIVSIVFNNDGFGWPRLLRASHQCPTGPTHFEDTLPLDEIVARTGGWFSKPSTTSEMRSALEKAQDVARQGRLAMIVIDVPDDDVPVGVRRLFLEPG